MFAQSAFRSGLHAYVIDLFGDNDTRRYAKAAQRVCNLDIEALEKAAIGLIGDAVVPLIYGSGLDCQTDALHALGLKYPIVGNVPDTAARTRDPHDFFALLEQLRIPYPEIRFSRPANPAGWLAKAACGEGGKRVAFLANFQPAAPESYYFQRLTPGTPYSLLFLANGKSIRAVGFNTQLTTSSHQLPFLFAGAIDCAALAPAQRAAAMDAAAGLTAALGLLGMNSLDFMADRDGIRVLEINPRPSATAQLYDRDFPEGWLAAHMQACRGQLPDPPSTSGAFKGFRTVYATGETHIRPNLNWPSYCDDLPAAGTAIGRGEPVCTVRAEAHSFMEVQARLSALESELLVSLGLTPAPVPSFTHQLQSTQTPGSH